MDDFANQTQTDNLAPLPVVDTVVDWVLKILMALACILTTFLIFITCIDVIGRYFLNMPVMGGTEMTEIALGLLVFSSVPIITYQQKHIVVDILDFLIPQSVKWFINVVSYALIGFGFWLLADYSEKLIKRAFRRDVVSEYLELPIGYIMVYAQITCYVTVFLMIALMMKTVLTTARHQ